MKTLRDGHIGYNETIALAVTYLSAKVFFTFPTLMVASGKTAGWLLVILSSLVALLGWLIIARLMSGFPGKSIIDVAEETAGRFGGLIFALIIFALFMNLGAVVLRAFSETMIATILPRTPISIVTGAVLIAILYASYLGLEAISRACFLISPFVMVALGLLLLGVLPLAEPTFATPILGAGLPALAQGSMITSSIFLELLILPVIYPAIRKASKFNRIGLWALGISTFIMAAVVLIFQMVFPYPMGEDIAYPLYTMARQITFARFIQRVESILLFLWIFGALLNLTISFYGAAVTLARGLHLPVYRPLLFPLIILLFSFSLMPTDFYSSLLAYTLYLGKYGSIPVFGLPVILLFLAWVRKKGGFAHGR